MNSFTISQLQKYTGVSAHCIRAWEKRYHALKPERSNGNTRNYDGHQLRRLLNITSLLGSPYKISELCLMSDSKLFDLKEKQIETSTHDLEFLISQMVLAALEFDEALFEKIFGKAVLGFGLEEAYIRVIYPTLERLGVLWSANKIAPAQEHFMSHLIRQKISAAIDLLPSNDHSKNHWMLFLPENDFHENGLLMAQYLIKNAQQRCTYLGANIPIDSLKRAVFQLNPSSLLLFLVTSNNPEDDQKLIHQMVSDFPSLSIYIAAKPHRLDSIRSYDNLTVLNSVKDLKNAILSLSK